MIWFLRLFSAFRELENLSQMQAESMEKEIVEHDATKRSLESERARRISAEAIASERREEVSRLVDQNREYRENLQSLTAERIKSLDNLNVKLMEAKAPEPTPDITQYNAALKIKTQMVQQIRDRHNAIDMAVLQKMHPAFQPRVVLNEPQSQDEESVA